LLLPQLLAPTLAHCSVATNADHRGDAAPAQIARLTEWLTAAGGDLAAVEIRASEVGACACFAQTCSYLSTPLIYAATVPFLLVVKMIEIVLRPETNLESPVCAGR
jgi:hypothetical protein